MAVNYEKELLQIFRQLDDIRQQEAVEKLRIISQRPKTVTGLELIELTSNISTTDEEAEMMQTAIDNAFGQIDDIAVSFDD